jgi:hypothetical protein
MGFFSFLKYITFIIFAAHLATSCGAPFENHWFRRIIMIFTMSDTANSIIAKMDYEIDPV